MRIHTVPPAAALNDPGREHRASEPDVPLRCCLRKSLPDEPVWLFRYTPAAGKGPYEEVGPIFVHVDCPGGAAADVLPAALLKSARVLRSYNAAGQIEDGVLVEPGAFDGVVAGLLDDPVVEAVQVRSLSHGCFLFAITRS
ncbi:DUF1203 domain-containing protein [Nocardia sp. NRRL S-836]|uniref:DUF1203 domain-containing protein n=1 Tax=Nocardia sp. NRRL S-836 TaxID=1519492 RepID=UPI0006B03BF6|nr:DUF1203 domain-containing protein [Nocardia sp. NRRL S-836]KOV78673.1 hypothetical protein ADL03_39450 [Nocardia sp. NRRL S-836]